MGLEFVCSDGKAVAVKWTPAPTQRLRTEIPETVSANGSVYEVEILTRSLTHRRLSL